MASTKNKILRKMKKIMENKSKNKTPRSQTYEEYNFEVSGSEEYEAKLKELKKKFLDKV
ncbi:MAG: hypothetical protein N4A57_16465 [Anaeromicrobium sp.]|jgi:hypothetical protein|uniref:hypothetical protein n=1 Tax=Anaeromicrobium sp. TaxID=1929132 RepID=UPI0025DF2B23|nr:hypothetical protein [Anaeromicrobium sp.]MCT4595842.1 hypothetical protein [Anaeromicrobium sp.]